MESDLEKFPENGEGNVRGLVVHTYLAKYLDMLYDGSISYERMDRRVFRLIWEHKKECLPILTKEPVLALTETGIIIKNNNILNIIFLNSHFIWLNNCNINNICNKRYY